MTSIIKVQNIQYTDGDAALTIADGGGVTAASTLTSTGAFTSPGIDDNASSNSIKINSNRSVGIGTSTATGDLNISPVVGSYTTIQMTSGGATTGNIIYFGDSTDADYSSITAFGSNAGESGRIRFIAGTNEAMNIYNTGIVKKPNHPCFRASGLGGAWSTGINDVVHFANDGNGFNFDIGNNYNTSSNGFFAPIVGKYQFYAQALVQNGTNQKRIKLRHNGTDFAIGNVYGYNSGSEVTVWVAGIVNMAQNDKIDVHLNTVGGNYYNHHPYTFFQGFLI